MKHRRFNAGRFALSGLAVATACLWGLDAQALGLGRVTVQSALGEPLRAEIDVTSLAAEEAGTLELRLASPDAYRAAGVEYNPVLPGAQVQLVRKPDGRSVIRISSARAVQEPFIDVILDMNWAGGKLVREFTMLLDPPATRTAQSVPLAAPMISAAPAPAPAPAPVVVAPTPAPAVAPPARAAAPRVAEARAPAAPAAAPAAPPPVRTAPAPAPRPPVAATPAAAPAPAAAEGEHYKVRRGDTLSEIAQRVRPPSVSLDQMLVALFRGNPDAFSNNNMNRLKAGQVLTVPSAAAAQQVDEGQAREIIQAQSADFDAYRRQLAAGVGAAGAQGAARVAKGTVQTEVHDSKQAAAASPDKLTLSQGSVQAAASAAATSRETEKKDDRSRVAELSRNVEELKQLQAATTASAPAAAAPAVTAAAPAAAASAAPAAVVAAVPALAASPAAAASPPAAAIAPAVVTPTPPAAADEPGLVDSLLDNPLLLPAGGVLVALLLGLGAYRLRGRLRKAERETSFLESRLQPDSFFGASGGERVDTHDAPSVAASSTSSSYALSQLDAIGDVDPVAEADVYLAYGRDLQAEEILKEAMRATPDRLAIRSKLLEVYAKRRDTKGFELLAGQLYALAGADSDEWGKAQELGRQIDPDNPLYAPGGQPSLLVRDGGRVIEPLDATTLPQSVTPTPPAPPLVEPATLDAVEDLDLELDLDPAGRSGFDHGASALETTRPFSTGATIGEATAPITDRPLPAAAPAAKAAGAIETLDFDLGDLSLDGAPSTTAPLAGADAYADSLPAMDLDSADSDPLTRKVELAEEFRQIGDLEGARDLLEEVIAQADGALKAKAQTMLAGLG